ncbi:DUF3158 family protein [Pseudomonas marginalis]|uniref:DUF3158 family protein n=1 Tax=Pseudomonas marginalis TaxID=298 RepID=A0A9X9BL20_PSEMA|nr:DUF3158 family protein [Pseudomonas marginalis]TWR50823.1 DUF3158 family protein [Pseudomonas marginalis]SEB33163.1 Protein of unknown function [Pseudomonas marginalis]
MGQQKSDDGVLQQTAFRPLQQDAFQQLQQAASLKGLLKPFKGKGELTQFAALCRDQESGLKALAQGVLEQARRYPFTLVPVRLTEQNTQAGTQFLRWQQVTDRRMGVGVWADMMGSPRTPESMLQDLYAMELQRITLNMQMSLVHSIAKQAAECAEKMGQAEAVYMARLQQLTKPMQHQ